MTKLHSKQHGEGEGAVFPFFFLISVTQKTNFTTTYCHTCKRAAQHDVTFTSSEIEREMGWVE